MFEKEAIRHAFEDTIGVECLIKPVEDFTYEELSDEQQEKAYDFQKGAEFGYNKAKEEMQEQGLALQSDMDKTIEQNIQLKKQIEKLEKLVPKTCENCVGYSCHAICVDCDFKDKWEVKEDD